MAYTWSNVVDNKGTTLNGSHAIGVGTLTVVSTSGFPATGYLAIDSGLAEWEVVRYSAIGGATSFTLVGVTANLHTTGGDVSLVVAAVHVNELRDVGGMVASAAANLVLATATSGGAAAPTLRALVAADIPSLSSVYEVVDATIVRTGQANYIDLTDGGATVLHSHAGGGGDISGTGVVGQVAEFVTNTKTLQAAKIIGPATNILTLTNAAAATLALAITSAKTLTLTATDNFNLTVPATGTAALLGTANVFTADQTISNSGLILLGTSNAGFSLTTANQYGLNYAKFAALTAGNGVAVTFQPQTTGVAIPYDFSFQSSPLATETQLLIIGQRSLTQHLISVDNTGLNPGWSLQFNCAAANTAWNAGNPSLIIKPGGNIAIGTLAANAINTTLEITSPNAIDHSYANVQIRSTDSQAIDKGGYLTLGGMYIGTSAWTGFGGIAGRKETNTSGEFGGYLSLTTYVNGGTVTEKMRISSFGVITQKLTNATTNAIDNALIINHNSSGTAAAGFGSGLLFALESSTTDNTSAALITASWVVATHASRTARMVLSTYDTAVREGMRIEASGTLPMVGFYGGAAVVRGAALTTQLTTLTHTAPGTPDYAIQDFTQTLPWGFADHDEANSVLKVIANLQVRCAELEARLGSATGVNLFA